MSNRSELIEAFRAITTLAGKADRNQQKVNMMHFMHGRADDAYHWQGFVDAQRARLVAMRNAFSAACAGLSDDEIGSIAMEAVTELAPT